MIFIKTSIYTYRKIHLFQQKKHISNMLDKEHRSKTPALQRSVAILEYVAECGSCPAGAIVTHLDAPKSSVYLLLDELKRFRLLTQNKDGHYQLGLKLIELGEQASGQLDLREIARAELEKLMQETGLLCHLGVFDGAAAYYILKVESTSTIRVRSWEGKRVSLCRSALGKCLLAWSAPEKQEQLLQAIEYTPATPTSILDEAQLRTELATIQCNGWGFDNEEDIANVRCIAAPVFGANGEIAAAISVVGTSLQVYDDNLDELVQKVKLCARMISKELGWSA